MSAIELKNVTFSYDGEHTVLNHVDFAAEYGEFTLLAGASGSGKSTVLSFISGIIPGITPGDLRGDVCIGGASILGAAMSDICRRVGIVLQNPEAQIVHRLVEDEIAFGLENLGFSEDVMTRQIDTVCRMMELDKAWQTRTLSGGQKQRLMTAATLAMGQKVLILDEPLANLDQDGAQALMALMKSLAENGYAVVIVEHRLDVVLPYADALWSVEGGTLKRETEKAAYLSRQTRRIADTLPPWQETTPLLELRHVAFHAGGREILKDITFTIPQGVRMAILGENGCGKTTLLRLITRLSQPTGGTIVQHLDGRFDSTRRIHKDWFKAVGVVYQNPSYQLILPTVRQEIAFGAASEAYADEIMEQFSISHLAERHPQSLSEGQKRRVTIAAIAATRPRLLILDEPTVGQDYRGLEEQVQLLNELHRQTGCTMLTVTHDMRCAEALSDRAVLIENGTIAREGGKELVREWFGIA